MNGRLIRLMSACAAMAAMPLAAVAQQATITGTVRSDVGEPLRFATVTVVAAGGLSGAERTSLGAQTNDAGVYSILVPSARVGGQTITLTVRLVGYKPSSQTFVLAAGTTTKDFRLDKNPLLLGEVIVTGSGTQQVREKIATAISSVKSEDIKKSSEPSVINALAVP